MSLAADVVVAFAGGVASFVSPCVLPLVPTYLAVVGAVDLSPPAALAQAGGTATMAPPRARSAITTDTLLFVAGFSVVFVGLGCSASGLGHLLIGSQVVLTRVAGLVVVAMALFLAGTQLLRSPRLYGEWRVHPNLRRLGRVAAPVAGAAFAFGWTPCVGPVLASILALASSTGGTGSAALQLAAYSAGLGTPFLAVAVCFDRLGRPLAWLRRRGLAVTVTSSTALALLGVLLALDRLSWVTTQLQRV